MLTNMFGSKFSFPFSSYAKAHVAQGEEPALSETDALFNLFESGVAGITETEFESGRFVRINQRFCDFMQRDAATLLALGPDALIHPDDRARVRLAVIEAMTGRGHWEAEVRHILPDGGVLWGHLGLIVSKRDPAGKPLRCIAAVHDVTESVKVKERLQRSEEVLRLGQQVGRIGSFTRNLETGVLECSVETKQMFGLPPVEGSLAFKTWLSTLTPKDSLRVAERVRNALARRDPEFADEVQVAMPSGRPRYIELRGRYFYDSAGRPLRSIGVAIDVTERKEAEERFAYAARHDSLTGLGNRTLFTEALSLATARAQRGEGFAVHCLDLDRFKDVNDTFGHPVGDRLLVEVAALLSAELRAGDMLARLGGDEFAVIQLGLRGPDDAARLAHRLVECLGEPFKVAKQRVPIGASVGVAVAPRDGGRGEELLSAADLALYQAKSQPLRGWRFFEPQMNVAAIMRRELERDLRNGVDCDQFELFYQPVLNIDTLRVKHFEALIRWRCPRRGLVSPDQFIPLCEETGLITQLGAWALRRACQEARNWPAPIGVAVNISAVQFAAGNLDRVVAGVLADTGLDPGRLELEITETSMLNNSEVTLAVLRKLKALGLRIAMDDFGAGHSSLGYLQSFPFDHVKIDRAFVRDVDRSPKNAAIVKAIVDLCSALGMSTTIEGVETEAQFQALAKLGGSKVQGFLFSPPQPAEGVPAMLAQFGGGSLVSLAAE